MKKVVGVLILISSLASVSYSQIQVGLRGGLNVSNIVGKYYNDFDYLVGPHAGAFMRFGAGEKTIFQPEVLFSTKGNTFKNQLSAGKYVNTLRLMYLDIPLMVGFKPFENFGFLLGVQPSILLETKVITRYAGKRTVDKNDHGVRTFDFGVVGGLQYEADSGVDLGLRVSYGFLDVNETSSGFHNRNLNFMATVGFAIGK